VKHKSLKHRVALYFSIITAAVPYMWFMLNSGTMIGGWGGGTQLILDYRTCELVSKCKHIDLILSSSLEQLQTRYLTFPVLDFTS
jgi:hypothetical protein